MFILVKELKNLEMCCR